MAELTKEQLKWLLWNNIDDFLNDCLDFTTLDEMFEHYSKKQAEIWCGEGHTLIPDQCGMPEHDYCAYCNTQRQKILEKNTDPLTKTE
jgi:hypothetical protein